MYLLPWQTFKEIQQQPANIICAPPRNFAVLEIEATRLKLSDEVKAEGSRR
jgi:hypothetical protein